MTIRKSYRSTPRRDIHLESAADQIAALMLPLVVQYQQPEISGSLKAYVSSTVNHMCRELEDCVEPLVSEAALEAARAISPALDLRHHHWDDQHRFDPGRKIFHWEHFEAAGDLRKAVLSAIPPSAREIAAILKRAKVAWILKSENRTLDGQGSRSERDDPEACYHEAGIILT